MRAFLSRTSVTSAFSRAARSFAPEKIRSSISTPRIALAGAPGERTLLFVLLRGAMDGMAMLGFGPRTLNAAAQLANDIRAEEGTASE